MNTERTPVYLTLGEAAKETGKSKSVLSKALKSGNISYVSKDDSGYEIDPSELFRVFPKNTKENGSKERLETHENTVENAIKIKELELRLEAALQERNFFKDQFAKLESDRDEWRTQAQRLALTYQKPPENREDAQEALGGTIPSPSTPKLTGGQIWGFAGLLLVVVLSTIFGQEIITRLIH